MATTATFPQLAALISAAAAVVTLTFGLFDGALRELMPKVDGAAAALGFASLCTLVLLVIITLVVQPRMGRTGQYAWAAVSAALLIAAMFVYFQFSDRVRELTYRYPPGEVTQELHVRGPYHEEGRARAKGMDTAEAVRSWGGPHVVEGNQLLWTSLGRSEVIGAFTRYFAALALCMTAAIYCSIIALWRARG